MAGEITSLNNPNLETTYINKRFMSDLLQETQMVQFCTPADNMPKHVGDTVRWLEFPEWTTDVTALDQTNPLDNNLALSGALTNTAEATLYPYGQFVEVGEFFLDTAPVGTLDKVAKRAADAGAAALDTLAMTAAKATTTIMYPYATSAGAIGVGTMTSGATYRTKAKDLPFIEAYFLTSGVKGFPHLNGQYGAVLHPNAGAQLMSEAAGSTGEVVWSDVNKHVAGSDGQGKILAGRMGSLFQTALFSSPYVDNTTQVNSTNVFNNIVLGHDGLGAAPLQEGGTKARVIIRKSGPQSTNDPYGTLQTVAWKWDGAFKLLSVKRVVKWVTSED